MKSLKLSIPQVDAVVLCFGLEAHRLHRQPWHVAHGIATGLASNGHRVALLTDANSPPEVTRYQVYTVTRLFEGARPSAELDGMINCLAPKRIFVMSGAFQIARLAPLRWSAEISLIMASPRLTIREILSIGVRGLLAERRQLTLPLINALLPGWILQRGYRRSGAHEVIYLSRVAQRRFSAVGLPHGRLLRPRVRPFLIASDHGGVSEPLVAYLGPALAARGADLAVSTFEQASALGVNGRLLLLIRPDDQPAAVNWLRRRVNRSPVRERICLEISYLSADALRERLSHCAAFLLPFRTPISEVPLVVLEAGLSGRPVVVLDVPGVGEYARQLGGVVARTVDELPHALIRAVRQPTRPTEHDPAWTSWSEATARLLEPPGLRLEDYRLICLCGVDGSGKTFLLGRLCKRLADLGVPHRHIWSRFRNYLSKPLLGVTRLTGHNQKDPQSGVRYRSFQHHAWLAHIFLAFQLVDNLLDIAFRYRLRSPGLIVGDRCVVDTLVDLAIDTGLDDLVIERIGPMLIALLPSPGLIVLIERNPTLVRRDRPDVMADKYFSRRRTLYRRLARRFDLATIVNDAHPAAAVTEILRLAGGDRQANEDDEGDLRLLQQ